jgi:arsenite methyltransferase
MADVNTAETIAEPCCAPEQQATCCEPSAKAECCGSAHDSGCGCGVNSTAVGDRDAPSPAT